MGCKIDNTKGSKISNFAQKQMEKMGWTEGMGLGKQGEGIVKHIVAVKRDENEGLGTKENLEATALPESWWHDGFANALEGFQKPKKKKKNKKDKDVVDPSKAPSFDELFKATGGARLGMRARADQTGKIKRSEGDYNESKKRAKHTEEKELMETVAEEDESESRKSKKKKKKSRKE